MGPPTISEPHPQRGGIVPAAWAWRPSLRDLRASQVSRNPMRSEGCSGVLKSVQANPQSVLELLDFSVSFS